MTTSTRKTDFTLLRQGYVLISLPVGLLMGRKADPTDLRVDLGVHYLNHPWIFLNSVHHSREARIGLEHPKFL